MELFPEELYRGYWKTVVYRYLFMVVKNVFKFNGEYRI